VTGCADSPSDGSEGYDVITASDGEAGYHLQKALLRHEREHRADEARMGGELEMAAKVRQALFPRALSGGAQPVRFVAIHSRKNTRKIDEN
jgi:hypothetical protein